MLGALTLLVGMATLAGPDAGPEAWAELSRGQLASVEVERVLYEGPASGDFWVHFRVRNLTARVIGLQLEPGWQVFYPNQWGGSPTEQRQVVDERRLIVGPLSEAERAGLLAAWKAGRLVRLEPGGQADYYRPFNGSGSGRAQVEAQVGAFLIVVLDGQLRLTDGSQVEQLRADDERRELALRPPLRWGRVPSGARVVGPRPALP